MGGKNSKSPRLPKSGGASALLARAVEHHVRAELVPAEQAYRELLHQFPSNSDGWCNLGVLMADTGRLPESEQALRRAIQFSPQNMDARANLGVVLRHQGRLGEALSTLQEALLMGYSSESLSYNLGVTLIDLGREIEAIEHLERAILRNPNNELARANLARALHVAGRSANAIPHGLHVLKLKDQRASAEFARRPVAALLREPTAADFKVPQFQPSEKKRNVIAFSLWGQQELYTQGAIVNARLAAYLYPEWTCRFYYDASVPSDVVQELRRAGAELVACESKGVGHGLFWRFYVANDPHVDRFLCRDCDSRLNVQERVAVDEWVTSGKPFHIMRDAVFHTELILAGLWGGVAGVLPDMRTLTDAHFRPGQHKWTDQDFLRQVIWPLVRGHCLTHDSYFDFLDARRFPAIGRRPPWLHVGAVENLTLQERAWLAVECSKDVPKT